MGSWFFNPGDPGSAPANSPTGPDRAVATGNRVLEILHDPFSGGISDRFIGRVNGACGGCNCVPHLYLGTAANRRLVDGEEVILEAGPFLMGRVHSERDGAWSFVRSPHQIPDPFSPGRCIWRSFLYATRSQPPRFVFDPWRGDGTPVCDLSFNVGSSTTFVETEQRHKWIYRFMQLNDGGPSDEIRAAYVRPVIRRFRIEKPTICVDPFTGELFEQPFHYVFRFVDQQFNCMGPTAFATVHGGDTCTGAFPEFKNKATVTPLLAAAPRRAANTSQSIF